MFASIQQDVIDDANFCERGNGPAYDRSKGNQACQRFIEPDSSFSGE